MQRKILLPLPLFLVVGCCFLTAAYGQTRTVETTRVIAAGPEAVLAAFLDDRELKAWWKVSRTLVGSQAGDLWSITWDDWGAEKTQHAWVGTIEEMSADRLLISDLLMIEPDMPLFGPMQIDINVRAVAGGTALTVRHDGYGYGEHWDRIYAEVVQGWDHVLDDLNAWFLEYR